MFTRVEPSRNEISIIDYFLVKKERIKDLLDIRVKRGHEIGSDHYLVKWIKYGGVEKRKRNVSRNPSKHIIKSFSLKEDEMAKFYQEEIERISREPYIHWDSDDMEESWKYFRKIPMCCRIGIGKKEDWSIFKENSLVEEMKLKKK